MTDTVQRKIKRRTILIYLSLVLAGGQSFLLHLGTTDYGHNIISNYFIIEVAILGVTVIWGLKNQWTRIILLVTAICETILFFQQAPISPDDILMIIVWIIRVYVISGLFTRPMNQYYKADK